MIIEYKSSNRMQAIFSNVDGMFVEGDHVILRRLATGICNQFDPPYHTVAILRLGPGEYVEVANELAGT